MRICPQRYEEAKIESYILLNYTDIVITYKALDSTDFILGS